MNDNENSFQEPLNSASLSIKEHFKSFIRNKSIEELIAYDNKLFSEVKNLESEKHILVTQNYKKFVSATETINTIRSSLIGFEKDLFTLKSKVQNIVNNFDTINTSVEGKLKETQNIYTVKKDLKRLKFINDLPRVLETQLNEFINSDKKDLKLLENSLIYYEKCKEFLHIHRENSLVKDIFQKTNDLIFKYRNLIQDELHIPDFSEANLGSFEVCLALLVKIEEDKSDLISTFLDRFKLLINKKYDEIFGMKDGVHEIDFTTYSKIYDNYEFAINENEFLFYENQIDRNNNDKYSNCLEVLRNLQSKFFKKGTFIWICKKIQENIVQTILSQACKIFTNLFDKKNYQVLVSLFNCVIEIFNKKIDDFIEGKSNYKSNIDPIFFKEGILSFYTSFCEFLNKIDNENINCKDLTNKILNINKYFTEKFIKNLQISFLSNISENIKNCIKNTSTTCITNFEAHFADLTKQNVNLTNIIIENIQILRKLQFDELFNISQEETVTIQTLHICNFLKLFYLILKSPNSLHFESYKPEIKNFHFEDFLLINSILEQVFKSNTKDRIYTKIIITKLPTKNGLKVYLEKLLKEFSNIRNTKSSYSELKHLVENETNQTLQVLFDSLVQLKDREIYSKLKELYFDEDWINYEKAVTFRLPLRNLCYELFYFKNEIYDLLEAERKLFEEKNASALNEALIWSKKQKRLTKYQKEMECLQIRRISVYTENKNSSPQSILFTVAKILLKNVNEFIKIKKFNQQGFQQAQLDLNFIKYFLKENIIIDIENILDGFFLEIMKTCSANTFNPESFDESLISGLIDENRKEFREMLNGNNLNSLNNDNI